MILFQGKWSKKYTFLTACLESQMKVSLSEKSLYCKGTDYGVVLLKALVVVSTGSPSISGAVIRRCWLQFHIQFISLLVAYSSLLAPAVLCLMPYAMHSLLRCCCVGSVNPLYWALLIPTACLLFWALVAPCIQ